MDQLIRFPRLRRADGVTADSIETVVGCGVMDGYVAIGGCQKHDWRDDGQLTFALWASSSM